MFLIDTEPVLRYLLDDDGKAADEIAKTILNEEVYITTEVLVQVVESLQNDHGVPRTSIANALLQLLGEIRQLDAPVAIEAILTYENTELDFTDCVLYARCRRTGARLLTFDAALKNKLGGSMNENDV